MADSVRLVLTDMARGLRDSVAGTLTVFALGEEKEVSVSRDKTDSTDQPMSTLARRRADRVKHREAKKDSGPKLKQRLIMCCVWNGGIFLLSILLFEHVLIPGLQFLTHLMFGGSSTHYRLWSYIGPVLKWTFGCLWILPLFLLSKVINSFWFQDIADAAYRKARGRPQTMPSIGKTIADVLFSILLQSLFLIQAMLAGLLPLPMIGDFVCLLHMSLLHSLYAFEYKWFNMGWEVQKRLMYIENNWPYFVGFGLPLAFFTSMPSSFVVSGCVFSILFPLFIISGNDSEPLPHTFHFPLKLFAPVVFISNAVFRHSVKKSKLPQAPATSQSLPSTPKRSPVH